MTELFTDGDRVSHTRLGLGTVKRHPGKDDLTTSEVATTGSVYVAWDDDRFPVSAVPASDLEKVPDSAAAISTGF